MIDKYNKLKIEFEKQKEYNIQLNLNLRSYKKRGSATPNHSNININKSTINKNNVFKITRFSHTFQKKIIIQKKIQKKLNQEKKV